MKKIFIFIHIIFSITQLQAIDVDPVGKEIKTGVKKYKLGDFHGSLEHFKQAEKEIKDDPRLEYNKGTAFYKMGDYSQALEAFEKALKTKDAELKAKTLYNLGNSHYKLGDKKKAIESYTKALGINPNFEPAKKNLEIVRKEGKKQNQSSDSEQNEKESESLNEDNSSSPSRINSESPKQKEFSQSQEQNQSLSKEEANRILESYKQDKVKRRKSSSPWSSYNEVFW